jgi:serine/threonine-protein kinase
MLPGSSEVLAALAAIARRQGHWDDAVAFFQQALVVDPRNAELLTQAADNYGDLRQFQGALKLYDRVLDIRPDDLDAKASKAGMYQAEGNLVEAAKYLAEVNPQTPSYSIVDVKLTQLRLERKHDEAVRLLKARFAEFQFGSELDQAIFGEFLSFAQRLAGDNDSAKASATHVRDMVVPLTRDQPDNDFPAIVLSRAYALRGEKEPALKEAERAMTLTPARKDAAVSPGSEENMAVVAIIVGENSRATEILTRLLHLPYQSTFYVTPITPALLRLDPTWDPLRTDLAFQKLCGERQP